MELARCAGGRFLRLVQRDRYAREPHGNDRDARVGDHAPGEFQLLLGETCTFHSSWQLDPPEFQFRAAAARQTVADGCLFPVGNQWQFEGAEPAGEQ